MRPSRNHQPKKWYIAVEAMPDRRGTAWLFPSFEPPERAEGYPGFFKELPEEEYQRLLTRRKRQVRDALNRCTDLETIERIARLLPWVGNPEIEIRLPEE